MSFSPHTLFPIARLSAVTVAERMAAPTGTGMPPENSPCARHLFGYLSTIRPLKVGLPVYPGQFPKSWGFLFVRLAR